MAGDMESDAASAVVSNPNEIKEAVDCISSLPDVILQHILSSNLTKFAIRTSVLSKRWKHVWSKTPSLFINSFLVDPSSINKTLRSYSALKITSFILLILENGKVTTSQSYIDSWIEFAMSRNAENLTVHLHFHISKFTNNFNYRFPDSFFLNSFVKKLDVIYYDTTPSCIVSWTSLTNLRLGSCKLSDESFANILAGCSMLEILMLSSCNGISHLDLSKSVNLIRLMLDNCDGIYHLDLRKSINLRRLEIHSKEPVEIVAPHVHYLSLSNSKKPSTLTDVSSLTEANLHVNCIEYGFSEFDYLQDMVIKMIAKMENIEKLTIGTNFLQILSLAELCGIPFPQFKIKALIVETKIVRSIIPGITRLLQNSRGLKKISVHKMYCNTVKDTHLDEYLKWKGLDPEQCWRSEYGVFLTSEETYDATSKHEASFENLLKGNTKTLETMVIQLRLTEHEKFLQMLPTI